MYKVTARALRFKTVFLQKTRAVFHLLKEGFKSDSTISERTSTLFSFAPRRGHGLAEHHCIGFDAHHRTIEQITLRRVDVKITR